MLTEIKEYIKETKPDGLVTRLKKNKEYWQEIEKYNSPFDCKSNGEKIYLYLNQQSQPLCGCGVNPVKFISVIKGYQEFCSKNCKHYKKVATERRVASGTANGGMGLSNPITKEKAKKTLKEKLNVENPGQLYSHKINMRENNPMFLETSKNRLKNTVYKKYGSKNVLQNKDIKEKIKLTNLEKFGFDNAAKNQKIRDKIADTKKSRFFNNLEDRNRNLVTPLFELDTYVGVTDRTVSYNWSCNECSYEFVDYLDDGYVPKCPKCYPSLIGISKGQMEVNDFIKNLGFNTIQNDKKTISKELDILIYEKNIAIEYCGLYYHSEFGPNKRGKKYHYDKMQKCHEKGIRLITIFEDEWENKREICERRLKNILNVSDNRLFARKLNIKNISPNDATSFFDEYHIQGGAIDGSIRLGLYDKDNLVSVMSFKKIGANDWELLRFASSDLVVGGASRLLKHFVKLIDPNTIFSYSDNRWGTGGVYDKLGFKFLGNTEPGYFYFHRNKKPFREDRHKFMKSKLIEKFDVDPEKSETEIMITLNYDRIWDCGHGKWIWKK